MTTESTSPMGTARMPETRPTSPVCVTTSFHSSPGVSPHARITPSSRERSSSSAMSALSTPTNATMNASSRSTAVTSNVRSNTSSEADRSVSFVRTMTVRPSGTRASRSATTASESAPGERKSAREVTPGSSNHAS
jgi:hypothetical protein